MEIKIAKLDAAEKADLKLLADKLRGETVSRNKLVSGMTQPHFTQPVRNAERQLTLVEHILREAL